MKAALLCPHCGKVVDKYRNPLPTVDIIIEVEEGIVLIKRKNPPYGWALPGGFVDYGESLEEAALREAKEETNLDVELLSQLGAYSDPVQRSAAAYHLRGLHRESGRKAESRRRRCGGEGVRPIVHAERTRL